MRGSYPYYGAAEIFDYINDYIFDGLHLLVAEDGTVTTDDGHPVLQLADGKFWVNNHAHIIKGEDDEDTKYLYYALSTIGINPYITGAVQLKITQQNLNSIEISFPEKSERQKLVEVLAAFDEKIENNNRIIKTLEEMAQAIFKKRFDVPVDDLPKGWGVRNVLEIVKRISVGKKYENKTALSAGKVPILDQGQSGYIGFHNDEPGVGASIDEPVVVFTNHTCNYRLMTRSFSAIQNVLPYVGTNGYPTLFVYYLTRGKITMQEYKGHWPDFEQQDFVVPPPALAEEFASFVKPMVQKTVEAENENQKLGAIRDLLLPRLMSGEIRV
ncbi:hypothetical protein A3C20_02120 [Candidatus Kaiserbacteria bacterium RIFCSPHIGHO2_02_FULL_55_25]|uniref:Type I restriction modification DNA specificity domain-containing protein n=1 Tax=Candidatus Kaiserbacteria bacterium RIFCSPHIGHO2_02_FULL_55_25 TaxID=1798498 RepID=A0A1F6E4J6_9BACT|nr:MAG: hypothetical protein A3C20_02120 [Candidatus Kaiserbacteria bacterium RIFCSPHIGHO2_02_FULL_55_25]OGG77068.1 MAG: hypothetical protein A3F56_01685 [Candidatus Kaiserbacteria bacterium RIFCSPHIGHO2_12_FULL_55_13]